MNRSKKNSGFTDSERYLKKLCEKSFLSLWSYPNLYYDRSKELCDLLVISGNDIVIFSDKKCKFSDNGDIILNWKRWFKSAVYKSALQIWGAEKQIKKFPDKIFLDKLCSEPIPVQIELAENTKIHLVVVAHGASQKCIKEKGGIGTLMFYNEIKGINEHIQPFTIGDLDPKRTFVHVFDDTGLDIVMDNLTTISDFTDYLIKRELFCRSALRTYCSGEEDLLSFYLLNWDREVTGENYFSIDSTFDKNQVNSIPINYWSDLEENPQWTAKLDADKASYFWDDIIENISKHAMNGSLHDFTSSSISDIERILRFLSMESRFSRRILSEIFLDAIKTTAPNKVRNRLVPPTEISKTDGLFYVFVLYPNNEENYTQHQKLRSDYLSIVCLIARLINPEAKHIVGIAKTSGINNFNKSEDLFYLDCSIWDEELEEYAKARQKELNIFMSHKYIESTTNKFPT